VKCGFNSVTAGFIGIYLAAVLLQEGWAVYDDLTDYCDMTLKQGLQDIL